MVVVLVAIMGVVVVVVMVVMFVVVVMVVVVVLWMVQSAPGLGQRCPPKSLQLGSRWSSSADLPRPCCCESRKNIYKLKKIGCYIFL